MPISRLAARLHRQGLLRRSGDSADRRGVVVAITPRRSAESDRKSTRLNSSHDQISYAVFCLKKKKKTDITNLQLLDLGGRDHIGRAETGQTVHDLLSLCRRSESHHEPACPRVSRHPGCDST